MIISNFTRATMGALELKLQEVAYILIRDDIYDINRTNIKKGDQQSTLLFLKLIIIHILATNSR